MDVDRPPTPSRAGSVAFAAGIGGLAGAALTAHRGRKSASLGALAGAVGLGAMEAVARARQRPGEIPALWQRIAVSSALVAPLGWAAGRFAGAGPVVVGTSAGAVAGAMGLRPQKVALGPLVGAAVGLAARGRRRPGADGSGGEHLCAGLPDAVGAAVPGRAGDGAGRAGPSRGPPVRGAAGGSFPLRRHRLREGAGGRAGRHLCRRRIRRRHRRLRRRPGRTRVRSRRPRPAGAGVLRAHDPVHARHRPRVAALGAAGLPAVSELWSPVPWARRACP